MSLHSRQHLLPIYISFLCIQIGIFIYDLFSKSQWAFDVVLAILVISGLFYYGVNNKITREGFLLANIGFLLHVIGSFGLYAHQWQYIEYDTIVHFFSAVAASYIFFNLIARKLHFKDGKNVQHTVIDEHIVILIFLVIASVAMMGVVVELVEFTGFMYLGEGEGMFFVGAGDSNRGGDSIMGQYIDTMGDMVVNTLGSFSGAILFYFFRYKKMYWLRRH